MNVIQHSAFILIKQLKFINVIKVEENFCFLICKQSSTFWLFFVCMIKILFNFHVNKYPKNKSKRLRLFIVFFIVFFSEQFMNEKDDVIKK